MKNLLNIFILSTLISGCDKKVTSPTTPVTSPPLTALEAAMIGDWATDSIVTYNNGVAVLHNPYNDPVNCHLVMTSTILNVGGTATDWRMGQNSANCGGYGQSLWKITLGKLETNGGSPPEYI